MIRFTTINYSISLTKCPSFSASPLAAWRMGLAFSNISRAELRRSSWKPYNDKPHKL